MIEQAHTPTPTPEHTPKLTGQIPISNTVEHLLDRAKNKAAVIGASVIAGLGVTPAEASIHNYVDSGTTQSTESTIESVFAHRGFSALTNPFSALENSTTGPTSIYRLVQKAAKECPEVLAVNPGETHESKKRLGSLVGKYTSKTNTFIVKRRAGVHECASFATGDATITQNGTFQPGPAKYFKPNKTDKYTVPAKYGSFVVYLREAKK